MLASKRGYALTGDESLSTRYVKERDAASGLFAELNVLMRDNPAQISQMNKEQTDFLTLSKRLDAEPLASNTPQSQLVAYIRGSLAVRDGLLSISQGILQQEKNLLSQRLKDLQSQWYVNQIFLLVGSAFFCVLFLIMNGYIFYIQSVSDTSLRKDRAFAESANRAKTDFLAHMSHEIRTPLTAISGIAEIFAGPQSNLDAKQKKLIGILSSSTSSLKDLVSDILDFSKIESGEFGLEQRIFRLKDVFEQVISIVFLKVGEKNIRFSFDYDAVKRNKLLGDSTRFRQILINLIGNAIKFTDKGSVTVMATKIIQQGDEEFLSVVVKDTGIGIAPENRGLIFERFRQADSSVSRKYGGTGLGLAISLRLARLMGGDITMVSVHGEGSTFTLTVPLKTHETPEDRETDGTLDKLLTDNALKQLLSQKTILVVDDYEGNIVVLSYLLDGLQCNYDVARTGLQALNMWQEKRYALILMDVQMPAMDGFTATTRIRAIENEKDLERTPIIGMTAHALVGDREKCIEAGMDAYLTKPFVELDLKTKIIEFLGQKKAA